MDRIPDNGPMDNPTPDPPLAGLNPADLLKQGAAEDTVASSDAFLPPTLEEMAALFPQFEILGLIGKGGMGAVYKVRQKELDRMVALKILPPAIGQSPAFSNRFTREAKALAKLNHPGIVTLHEFGQADGLYFIVMEYVDGVNLGQLMRSGRISPREALAIVPQICDALQFAHDQGIVHRDIKPENILLDRLGRVKVADFGIAKLVDTASSFVVPPSGGSNDRLKAGLPTFTEAGKVIGTPQYMAPEQIDHPADVDHRADIYALGVVFYQMLTGELPGKELQAPSRKVRIDVRLDQIVLQALEKDPSLRFQQVSLMKTRMEDLNEQSQPETVPVAVKKHSTGSMIAIGCGVIALLGLVAVLALGAVFASWNKSKRREMESLVQSRMESHAAIEQIRVFIEADQTLKLEGKTLSLRALEDELKKRVGASPDLSVRIRSDPQAKYSTTVDVMEVCGKAGIRGIDFAQDETRIPSGKTGSGPEKPEWVEAGPIKLSMIGGFAKPGNFPMPSGCSLLDAVAAAGGWKETADLRKVTILNPGGGPPETCDLLAILRGKAPNPVQKDGAVVSLADRNF